MIPSNIILPGDPPTVAVHVLPAQPGEPVKEVRLEVTAHSDPGNGSEFIDRVQFTGLPEAAIVAGADATGVV